MKAISSSRDGMARAQRGRRRGAAGKIGFWQSVEARSGRIKASRPLGRLQANGGPGRRPAWTPGADASRHRRLQRTPAAGRARGSRARNPSFQGLAAGFPGKSSGPSGGCAADGLGSAKAQPRPHVASRPFGTSGSLRNPGANCFFSGSCAGFSGRSATAPRAKRGFASTAAGSEERGPRRAPFGRRRSACGRGATPSGWAAPTPNRRYVFARASPFAFRLLSRT